VKYYTARHVSNEQIRCDWPGCQAKAASAIEVCEEGRPGCPTSRVIGYFCKAHKGARLTQLRYGKTQAGTEQG
jgi:hypothetical protein